MSRASPGALAAGALAALRSPWWVRAARLRDLLVPSRDTASPCGDAGPAVRAALLALRLLARLRLPLWRNTCLYRSIAECLVLRWYGISCRLQIGVLARTAPGSDVNAHAWVVRLGGAPADPPPGAVALLQ